MERAAVIALLARAREALADRPGVRHMGYGLKVTGGRTTDTPALRVTVDRKRPLSELADGERLPDRFEELPVDVLEPRRGRLIHCEDTQQYSRILGGISIANFKTSATGSVGVGTLGCFARIKGVNDPNNVVLLSNRHVLAKNGAVPGDTIYQPKFDVVGNKVDLNWSQESQRPIAHIHKAGFEQNLPFTYTGEPQDDFYVDAATAKLIFKYSSLCKCFKGTRFRNAVRDLQVGGAQKSDKITGKTRITDADVNQPSGKLVKVGRRTHRTEGRVTAAFEQIDIVDDQGNVVRRAENVIEIEPTADDCDGIRRFGDESDSGSVVVNDKGEIAGLLFLAGSGADNTGFGYACHIDPVLHHLDIELVSTARPPVGPAGQAASTAMARIVHAEPQMVHLEARITADPALGPLLQGFLEHLDEIVDLVNHRRRLLLAWHRLKGPAYLAHLGESARRPAHAVPHQIEGVERRKLLAKMADLLIEEGSRELADYLRSMREETLDLADRVERIHDLAADTAPEPANG